MDNQQQYQKYVGGMWAKTSDNEKKTRYYSGSINVKEYLEQCGGVMPEEIRFICFRNFNKVKETHPDYNILKSKPKGEYVKPAYKSTDDEDAEFDKKVDEGLEKELQGFDNGEIPF